MIPSPVVVVVVFVVPRPREAPIPPTAKMIGVRIVARRVGPIHEAVTIGRVLRRWPRDDRGDAIAVVVVVVVVILVVVLPRCAGGREPWAAEEAVADVPMVDMFCCVLCACKY